MQLWPEDVRNVQPSDVVELVDRVQQVACIDFDMPQSHSCNQKTPMKIRHRNILSAAMLATACPGAMAAATDYLNRVYGGASGYQDAVGIVLLNGKFSLCGRLGVAMSSSTPATATAVALAQSEAWARSTH